MLHDILHFLTPFMWAAFGVTWWALAHKRKTARLNAQLALLAAQQHSPAPSPLPAEHMRELEALRERVKVLERIATEERHSRKLADDIEALR